MELFDRDPQTLGKTAERASWPIEQKESFRWLKGYRLACDLQQQCPETQVVSVADRECDLYDIFVAAVEHPSPADFLIRSKEERRTPERDPDAGAAAYRKMRDEVCESVLRYRKTLDLPRTPQRASRQAEIEVRAKTVTLKPPHARGQLPSVTINVIQAVEVNGPGDGTDVEWWLLTSLPIETFEELERALDYYAARWTIEVYFRVLKTGCRVEDIQLETKSRFSNCLAFYKIIAWRVMHVTHQSRESPDIPCSVLFTPAEWKSVWHITTGAEPTSPPSLDEFTKQLATLGGYNNRKRDGPPGPESLWIAIRRMNDFALAWMTFKQIEQTCV